MKIIAASLLLVSSSLAVAGTAPNPPFPFDFTKNDADLIRFIQQTDPVFTSALGLCSNDKIERSVEGEGFVYTTQCAIKPLSDTPCPAYSVLVTGNIDSPSGATVNSLTLARLCPGQ